MQKSQQGLLRSLLFEILRQCPELIPTILPVKVTAPTAVEGGEATSIGENWTRHNLLMYLRSIVQYDIRHTKFRFFIDGTDEYVGERLASSGRSTNEIDHSELIDMLTVLISDPNVKICVSSREWDVFDNAFKGFGRNTIALQHLTKGDIRNFVLDRLQKDKDFRELMARDVAYRDLVEDFVSLAQGVFLWAALAVTRSKRVLVTPTQSGSCVKVLTNFLPPVFIDHAAHNYCSSRSRLASH